VETLFFGGGVNFIHRPYIDRLVRGRTIVHDMRLWEMFTPYTKGRQHLLGDGMLRDAYRKHCMNLPKEYANLNDYITNSCAPCVLISNCLDSKRLEIVGTGNTFGSQSRNYHVISDDQPIFKRRTLKPSPPTAKVPKRGNNWLSLY
jgi:hypothetical protein